MSSRSVKRRPLEFCRTISYFKEQIECGHTLSKKVVEAIDFSEGVFFTVLPENANVERLYEFSYGGIIPPIPYGTRTYKIKGKSEPFHPQQIITMDRECSKFIHDFLKESKHHFSVIENYGFEADNPLMSISDIQITPFGSELYYFLCRKNSPEAIYDALRGSTESWHSLAILFWMDGGIPDFLDEEKMDLICKHAKVVITSAYDDEAFIFWERSSK